MVGLREATLDSMSSQTESTHSHSGPRGPLASPTGGSSPSKSNMADLGDAISSGPAGVPSSELMLSDSPAPPES